MQQCLGCLLPKAELLANACDNLDHHHKILALRLSVHQARRWRQYSLHPHLLPLRQVKMLSLKSTAIYQTAPSKINLLDLPAELIGTILDQLPLLDDLLSASLVSKRLREETLSILFYSINLTFTTNFRRHGKTILDYLLANPSLSRHVREVNIRKPVGAVTADLYEVAKLDRLSSQLQSLHTIKYENDGQSTHASTD